MKLIGWCKLAKGQRITVPKKVREQLNITIGDVVGFWEVEDKIVIGPAEAKVRRR